MTFVSVNGNKKMGLSHYLALLLTDKLYLLGVFAQQPRGAPTGEVARVKAE